MKEYKILNFDDLLNIQGGSGFYPDLNELLHLPSYNRHHQQPIIHIGCK